MIVEGYVELSAHDILNKSFFLSAVLALHGGYRALRFREHAVLLQSSVPFNVLYGAMALVPLGQNEPHAPALLDEQL